MLVDDRGTRPVLYTGREETEFERKWSFEQMKSSILTKQQKSGVMFLPNTSGNGGHITNSYKITDEKTIREYADYLMNQSCLSGCFAGSVEGFVFEWQVHNVAYWAYSTIGNTEKAKSAKHLDIGKTIYADNHGKMSGLMFLGFRILYPNLAITDKEIYDSLY